MAFSPLVTLPPSPQGRRPGFFSGAQIDTWGIIHVLTRFPKGRIEALRDDAGVAVKRVRPIIGPDFTMVAAHLGSKRFRTQEDQAFAAASINRDIEGIEHRVGHRRTMVIGDFNMSPFELGLVSSRLLSRGDVATDSATAIAEGRQPHAMFLLQPDVEPLRRSSSQPSRVLLPPGFGTNRVFLVFLRSGPAAAGSARFLPGRRTRDSHPDRTAFAPESKRHSRFQSGVRSPAAVPRIVDRKGSSAWKHGIRGTG